MLTRAQGPAPLLAQLSRSLDAHPAIALERIEWSIVEGLAPATADGPYAQARIDARLPLALVGDPRGQLALVAEFARHLGAAPATQATVLQAPVDTQSVQTLRSGDARPAPEAPRFSLRLTHKL